MKHTDFYKLIEEIKLQEQCELKAAIKSVGGCYIWVYMMVKPNIQS